MLKAETTSTRAPRGTKPVSQAFFTALESVPEASRAAVAKAAQVMIRDELKVRREKMKAATAKEKEKARSPAPAPKTTKAAAPRKTGRKPAAAAATNGAAAPSSGTKRRTSKTADTTVD